MVDSLLILGDLHKISSKQNPTSYENEEFYPITHSIFYQFQKQKLISLLINQKHHAIQNIRGTLDKDKLTHGCLKRELKDGKRDTKIGDEETQAKEKTETDIFQKKNMESIQDYNTNKVKSKGTSNMKEESTLMEKDLFATKIIHTQTQRTEEPKQELDQLFVIKEEPSKKLEDSMPIAQPENN